MFFTVAVCINTLVLVTSLGWASAIPSMLVNPDDESWLGNSMAETFVMIIPFTSDPSEHNSYL